MHKSTCVSRADHTDGMSSSHDRRIEVIADGLPLWGGAQLAVDTTLVSPLTRAGRLRMRGGQYRGTALRDARRNKERTYPEFLRDRRCRLVVFGIEVGGRWSDRAATFLGRLAHTKGRQAPALLRHSSLTPWSTAGAPCSRMRPCMPLQHPSLTKTYLAATSSKAIPLPSVRSSLKSPAPPLQQTCSPFVRRPAWTWPSPLHIREPPVYKWLASCPMPGHWPVKPSLLLNVLRSKRHEKEGKTNHHLENNAPSVPSMRPIEPVGWLLTPRHYEKNNMKFMQSRTGELEQPRRRGDVHNIANGRTKRYAHIGGLIPRDLPLDNELIGINHLKHFHGLIPFNHRIARCRLLVQVLLRITYCCRTCCNKS